MLQNMLGWYWQWRFSCMAANWHVDGLTHWGRVTHICVVKLTIIGSDNGLSPGRRQAITWTNDGILLIGPLGTNFSGILSKILTFSFKKMHLKTSSVKWRPFCLGLNVLMQESRSSSAVAITLCLSCTNPMWQKVRGCFGTFFCSKCHIFLWNLNQGNARNPIDD